MKSTTPLFIACARVLLSLCAVTLGYAQAAQAAGELMVHPTRVVFEGASRSAQVELINSGRETATYRIAFENKRMTEAGHFETVPAGAPGAYSADFVHFSPRQVVLAPGASQIVRLYLRKPAGLVPGEYRSHLAFKAVPPATRAHGPADSKNLTVQLIPVFGVTIPVIVRQGDLSVRAQIANLSFRAARDDAAGLLRVQLQRSGERSLYGDVEAYFLPPGGGERVIGRATGVAVYTPNPTRTLFVPLTQKPSELRGGKLRVTYRARPEEGGAILAETTVAVR